MLKSMKPKLIDNEFVFCTISDSQLSSLKASPLLIFKEDEGTSIILKKEEAEANSLSYSDIWALITLTVHSDLKAVGLLAEITNKLSKAGISVNIVSAYYHDHLFVPYERAKEAMKLLSELK